jgi:hypothetical protein
MVAYNHRRMYILTKVNEEGYTNREVFASMNLENVLDVMKGMITIQYQEDRGLIEGLLDQFYTIDARAEVRRRLEEDRYYSLSGPDETPFEIAVMGDEQDMVDFYRQAGPQNAPMNNANNENDYVRYEAERMMGGKRKYKARKTRKAKKSKKSKKTRRH